MGFGLWHCDRRCEWKESVMALVEGFAYRDVEGKRRVHQPVRCTYSIFESERGTVLQLDTFGTEARKDKGKLSQTIQLDAISARELVRILESAFPGTR